MPVALTTGRVLVCWVLSRYKVLAQQHVQNSSPKAGWLSRGSSSMVYCCSSSAFLAHSAPRLAAAWSCRSMRRVSPRKSHRPQRPSTAPRRLGPAAARASAEPASKAFREPCRGWTVGLQALLCHENSLVFKSQCSGGAATAVRGLVQSCRLASKEPCIDRDFGRVTS